MREKICRLCLQAIVENYQGIEEAVKNVLKMNLDISKETVICNDCANKLQVLSKLKSACACMRNKTLPLADLNQDVSLDSVKNESTNDPKSIVNSKDEIRCCFCARTIERESLVSLNESKENKFLVYMLEKHFSEMNLNNTEKLLTCQTCLETLQGVSSFLNKCSNVEEKISRYVEIEGTDDRGQIELKHVQQFIFKPRIKFEFGSCSVNNLEESCDQVTVKDEDKIKCETDIDSPELISEVDIKSEQSDRESVREYSAKIKLDNGSLEVSEDKCETQVPMYQCEICLYVTKHKASVKRHILRHKNYANISLYKCDTCTYETNRRDRLNDHKLTHKSRSEITTFKCEKCAFETKRKNGLKKHMSIVHKHPSEITLYNCEMCTYETIHKEYINRHRLTHTNPSEIINYKCDVCTYETKRKDSLIGHKLTHKSPSEITMFKCDQCSFETKRKPDLKRHTLLIHKNPSDVTFYKCESCSYETKHKIYLNRHKLVHKSPSETTMFKCEICAFETKRKYALKKHTLTHRNSSEGTLYKCETCSYETTRKDHLNEHQLTHKNSVDSNVHVQDKT